MENETRFNLHDIAEISLKEEEKAIFKTWEQIGSDISMFSRMEDLSLTEFEFSGSLLGMGNDDLLLRINTSPRSDIHEPDLIMAYLFQGPIDENGEAELLDINTVRIDWDQGQPRVISVSGVAWNESGETTLDLKEMSFAAKKLVAASISNYQGNDFPLASQTDLMS